jgi:hypothetical protein
LLPARAHTRSLAMYEKSVGWTRFAAIVAACACAGDKGDAIAGADSSPVDAGTATGWPSTGSIAPAPALALAPAPRCGFCPRCAADVALARTRARGFSPHRRPNPE